MAVTIDQTEAMLDKKLIGWKMLKKFQHFFGIGQCLKRFMLFQLEI